MTDNEREAQILREPAILPDCMMPDGADPCAGYTRLREVIEGQGLSMAAMGKELTEARAKIARLRASPDCLDEAARAIDHIKALGPPEHNPDGASLWDVCCDRCRASVLAIRVGGNPAADAPPEADAMERARLIYNSARNAVAGVDAKSTMANIARALTEYGDQRARAARTVAIEEVARVVDNEMHVIHNHPIVRIIRALADKEPKP